MKFAVIGYSGAGKSTLAARLGEIAGVPVLHLDKVQFLPGWEVRDLEESRAMVEEFLDRNRSGGWVIDGNYTNFHYDRRMEEADLVFFLNFPRRICLPQALYRNWKYKEKSRESIAEGCNEKMDLEFLWWILYKGRSGERRRRNMELLERYPGKVIRLHSHREVETCLKFLAERLRQVSGDALRPAEPEDVRGRLLAESEEFR